MNLILFIVFCFLAAYPILIYPIVVLLAAATRPREWQEGIAKGKVAFIVTVFNEEARIGKKLENSLQVLAEIAQPFELIVASDGSTDDTESIVGEFADRGVRWLPLPRGGKENAQIAAIRETGADILIFSDASTTIDRGSVVRLLAPFADPQVAAVSGRDRVDSEQSEQSFLNFEMTLRAAESKLSSVVGLSGCFFGIRKEVAAELLPDVPSDLGGALICIRQGKRAVSQSTATCVYPLTTGASNSFRRWRRTALRGIRCLWAYRNAISLSRPIVSWQIISHKWMRFASPIFATAALIVALVAAARGQSWASLMLAGPIALLVCTALLTFNRHAKQLLRLVGFAAIANTAVLSAWMGFLCGERKATWTPTAR